MRVGMGEGIGIGIGIALLYTSYKVKDMTWVGYGN